MILSNNTTNGVLQRLVESVKNGYTSTGETITKIINCIKKKGITYLISQMYSKGAIFCTTILRTIGQVPKIFISSDTFSQYRCQFIKGQSVNIQFTFSYNVFGARKGN